MSRLSVNELDLSPIDAEPSRRMPRGWERMFEEVRADADAYMLASNDTLERIERAQREAAATRLDAVGMWKQAMLEMLLLLFIPLIALLLAFCMAVYKIVTTEAPAPAGL